MNRSDRPARCTAVHDLSGLGRCSLTVILPAMSVMGVQVCPLPTAILSAHTGGFGSVARRDLTDYLDEALAHYRTLGLPMECVYTGYLGSAEQVALCQAMFDEWPNAMKVVDPVMGDHGKLYHGFTPELVQGIRCLATHADVITPNLTEAALLLGEEPNTAPLSLGQARSLLARLSGLGPEVVVVTGVALTTGEYANLCYDKERGGYWQSVSEYLPVRYPGTGDLFAAVLTAGLMQGDSPAMAMDRATRYVEITVKTTFGYGADPREGVMLERTLGWLTQKELPRGYRTL